MTGGPGFSDSPMEPVVPARGHVRQVCGAALKQAREDARTTCDRPAGWGTQHVGVGACRTHAGNTPTHVAAAARQLADQALAEAVATYGLPVDVEPGDALLGLVRTSAGIVRWLGAQVAALEEHRVLAGDKVSPLVQLYLDERKELARVAKTTLDAGVAERRVRLAEAQGEVLVQVLQAFAGLLGHDPADPAVRAAARTALLTIEGETAP